jgi:hypothetical protein
MRLHMRNAVRGVNSEGWVFMRQRSFIGKLYSKECVSEARMGVNRERGVSGERGGGKEEGA